MTLTTRGEQAMAAVMAAVGSDGEKLPRIKLTRLTRHVESHVTKESGGGRREGGSGRTMSGYCCLLMEWSSSVIDGADEI